ncbi:phosphatidylinositol N-acetylglucosaminyltransferase subunit Q-like isoform X2 [Mercenaria mercenaria]|nr:phosphatidylinositol N-acetylglucosaminyltransferase subunit Q-like isoform X2 [Mercenaria mercenaria]
MTSNHIWKVFAPYDVFSQPEAYLIGHVTTDSQSIYITASSHDVSAANQLPDMQLIGYWSRFKNRISKRRSPVKLEQWISVWKDENADIHCEVINDAETFQCTLLIYNPSDVFKSEILKQKNVDACEQNDNITSLVRILHATNSNLCDLEVTEGITVYTSASKRHGINQLVVWFLMFMVNFIYLPFRICSYSIQRNGTGTGDPLQKVMGVSSTFSQLAARSKQLCHTKSGDELKPFCRLRSVNTCLQQLIDTLLGVTLMYFLMSDNMAQYLANICLSYGDKVAGELKVLLDWLMGAPAGLKLNSQLTHILGKFFQYHIYLWSGYLYVLKPVLGQLVYYGSIAGVWGLSVQLALFQDILSTMTIHIYCFYVYAARLYRLQMYAMASLWRLFRGKKWNVLRQRVDSAVYDADQLFVGTLLFTVLLFLLPTTGLYYIVFTLLRVMVLTVQGVVSRLRQLLNHLPCWYILLWLAKSTSLTDGAVFQFVSYNERPSASTLVLSMQATRPSFSELLCLMNKSTVTTSAYSWGTIVKNLFLGHLIYPWIEKKKST